MIARRTISLSARQDKAIIALLNEATVARASAICGIPERTIYNWLGEPDFSAAYHRHRREAFGQAVAMTQRYAPLAVNTLARVMQDETAPHHARVTAAANILRFGREGIELDDLAQRVEALEQAARDQPTGNGRAWTSSAA